MYAKIEPSGCGESHGNVETRFAFYLEPGDARYKEHHVQVVDKTCPIWLAGYSGERNERGRPVDKAAYKVWRATCRHIWQDNPFHNHFIKADPDVTDEEIQDLADFHLANFYKAWRQKKPIRTGWDVSHRARPLRYEELDDPEIFALRKAQCLERASQIKALILADNPPGEGRLSPSTDIDIGTPAIDGESDVTDGDTVLNAGNPANDTGVLDTFKVWVDTAATAAKIGTFYSAGGNNWTGRDYESVGSISSGSEQTISGKDCDVATSDIIGMYDADAEMVFNEESTSSWYDGGDSFGSTEAYEEYEEWTPSLEGEGETVESDPQLVTPGVLALSDAQFAPVIGWGIIPPVLALTDTQYAPTIKHKIIVPLLALSDTQFIPTIGISGHVEVIPSTLALSDTLFAPIVSAPRLCTPSTLALSDAQYAPTIKLKIIIPALAQSITLFTPVYGGGVVPTTLSLSDAQYAPTIKYKIIVPVLVLSDTMYVPVVISGGYIVPTTLVLSDTMYAPTILTPKLCTPSTLALSDTQYAPVFGIGYVPTTLALVLVLFIPDAKVPGRGLYYKIVTSQHRDVKAMTSQHRDVKALTSQHRDVKVITSKQGGV